MKGTDRKHNIFSLILLEFLWSHGLIKYLLTTTNEVPRPFGGMVTEHNIVGVALFFRSGYSSRPTLWAQSFSLCLLPPHSYFFALILKNWLHTQLGLAWFLSQMLGLAPFPTGHWELQVSCILIPCLARHHKSATLIREVQKKKDLFSYPYVYHGVTHLSYPKPLRTIFSLPASHCPVRFLAPSSYCLLSC